MTGRLWKAAADDYSECYRLLAYHPDEQGRIALYAKYALPEAVRNEQGAIIEPSLTLSNQEARSLMNALWHAGLRPSEFQSPNGEINRMSAHLEDMRRLVFERK